MPKVFVAYGADHKARDDVCRLLVTFGLKPVVFSKSPDHSKAVIEKFEQSGGDCEFAIILLTPDDRKVIGRRKKVAKRARQNVIFEMGWFFGHLGRHKTLLLRKGATELPSDISGVLYKQYMKSPLELRDEIARALKAGGVRINHGRGK